jgi:tousled-like kinase
LRERDRYELEKGRLIREMKRLRDEDGSRFNNFQILHHRYALLNLLGKGGFSEVYKVYFFFSSHILNKKRSTRPLLSVMHL